MSDEVSTRKPTATGGLRVLLLSGSLRSGSLNTAALRAAAELLGASGQVAAADWLRVDPLPFYNADRGADGAGFAEVTSALRHADGLLIATPEYNGNPPGFLLNALDWLSSGPEGGPLLGLSVGTLSASPGARGGADAQVRLREVLIRCGARVTGRVVALDRAAQRLDATGEFSDGDARRRIAAAVTPLLAACRETTARAGAHP
ncbi:NADPH-dependent FMN reductase [Streptomyces litchfieldiae]|uniref:NADPH-dependent FMN reductase n=1 Tax=Streptomyces litchfieldiae TaxID=3075543 RepID=A0ABU2MR78_9ACTN|nr:NADPH-dependent FMN reductase [Streptomyces sp. DSM 44938]MDT0343604.1 NADPH-dependent FMN reductase [Streptomyces sp. DSM 44938]